MHASYLVLSYCISTYFSLYYWSSSFIINSYQVYFISHDSNLFPGIKGSFQEKKRQIVAITDLQPSAPEVHRPCCKSSLICASVCLCVCSVSECTGCIWAGIIDYTGKVAPASDSCPPEATWSDWEWKRQKNWARSEQLWTCQSEYEPLIRGIFSLWMGNYWPATGRLSHPSK